MRASGTVAGPNGDVRSFRSRIAFVFGTCSLNCALDQRVHCSGTPLNGLLLLQDALLVCCLVLTLVEGIQANQKTMRGIQVLPALLLSSVAALCRGRVSPNRFMETCVDLMRRCSILQTLASPISCNFTIEGKLPLLD